jgi:hypothetical protein
MRYVYVTCQNPSQRTVPGIIYFLMNSATTMRLFAESALWVLIVVLSLTMSKGFFIRLRLRSEVTVRNPSFLLPMARHDHLFILEPLESMMKPSRCTRDIDPDEVYLLEEILQRITTEQNIVSSNVITLSTLPKEVKANYDRLCHHEARLALMRGSCLKKFAGSSREIESEIVRAFSHALVLDFGGTVCNNVLDYLKSMNHDRRTKSQDLREVQQQQQQQQQQQEQQQQYCPDHHDHKNEQLLVMLEKLRTFLRQSNNQVAPATLSTACSNEIDNDEVDDDDRG